MVYEKPYVTKVNSNIRKRAEQLLEKGLISKSFNKLRNEEKEGRKVIINDETIDKFRELHLQRNTKFYENWMNHESNRFFMADVNPDTVEKAINFIDAEIHPGLMKFRAEHLQDLIGGKGTRISKKLYEIHQPYIEGNKLPKSYHQFIGSCQSIPLPKGTCDIRPIAIPHIARKIAENAFHTYIQRNLNRTFKVFNLE